MMRNVEPAFRLARMIAAVMPSPTAASTANRIGILTMTLAMASFVVNDTLVKYVSASLPAAQLIFLRGVFCTLLLAAAGGAWLVVQRPGRTAQPLPWTSLRARPLWLRSVLDTLGTLAYLASLFHMPLGNAVAINSATPLVMTLAAAWILRERVGPLRWSAIVVGFIGVWLVVQPAAEGFNAWSLLCLAGTLVHTGRDLVTRRIPRQVPTLVVTLAAAITVTVTAGLLSLADAWQPVDLRQMAMIAAASVFLGIAYFLIVMGMRHGEVSVVSPFRYTALLFALLLGWLVWGDLPNALAWTGIAMLVGAGLVTLRR